MRGRRPALLLIVTLLLLPPAVAAGQERGPWSALPAEVLLAERARALLNEARAESGAPPLAGNPALDALAYQHAREMALRASVTHHSYLYGVGTSTRVRLAFPLIFQFGENVARNRDVDTLHRALLASPGHRLNRLDPSFTHVGMGVARAGDNELYLAEVFVRTGDESALEIATLYSTLDAGDLPDDQPAHGEVTSEVIRIGAPGPDDPESWTRTGINQFLEGRYDDAVRDFETALEIDPDYAYARFNLARALLRSGRADRALEVLEGHLSARPEDIDAWWTRGAAALLTGDHALAERSFRRVLEDRAREASAWYNLGLALEYQGRLEEAESAFAQALHLDPDLHAARDALNRLRR